MITSARSLRTLIARHRSAAAAGLLVVLLLAAGAAFLVTRTPPTAGERLLDAAAEHLEQAPGTLIFADVYRNGDGVEITFNTSYVPERKLFTQSVFEGLELDIYAEIDGEIYTSDEESGMMLPGGAPQLGDLREIRELPELLRSATDIELEQIDVHGVPTTQASGSITPRDYGLIDEANSIVLEIDPQTEILRRFELRNADGDSVIAAINYLDPDTAAAAEWVDLMNANVPLQ